ncbi:fluoride efflux transporter FluC [Sporosarcina sp. G11-34]|uniref:fluoride efflux transporter FluC n=1 Tax=Sporosarcina sp. G11-34 TaxID=2849605 RepID=UPI0022A8DDD5|nr:CrcB family protein [Sporosarcina sp. G11-34]MCZ2260726.1 CrcB family protein [Sporosarcina sp. G11-34]
MKKILWIGLVGALGAVLRTTIGQMIHNEAGFPIATFTVNIIGTFLLCFLVAGMVEKLSKEKAVQDAITTGLLGSFTTFSALSMETVLLVENGQSLMALSYVGLSILFGLGAGLLGFYFGRKKVAV